MDQTHSTSQALSSTQDPYHDHGMIATIFRFIAPLNLTLAGYIVLQNTAIIYHYYSERRRLTSLLVIIIASVDVLNAMTEFIRGSVSLICISDEDNTIRIANWIPVSYVGFGVLCNCVSIFSYTVLSVVMTINLVNPFFRINKSLLWTILAIVAAVGFCVFIIDIIYPMVHGNNINMGEKKERCRDTHWPTVLFYSFISEMMLISGLYTKLDGKKIRFCLLVIPVFLEYILPCILVFASMVIQTFVIRKAVRMSPSVLENQARQVNITILLITVLFLLCNGTLAITFVIIFYYQVHDDGTYSSKILVIRMVSQYTLPLLNAAVFPIIIILRNTSLRETYKSYIVFIISIPAWICRLFRQFGQHRRNKVEASHVPRSVQPIFSDSGYGGPGTETATDRSFTAVPTSRPRVRARSI